MNKPRVLMVTRIPFWRMGAGERTRVLALVWLLGAHCRLSLLYLGPLGDSERQLLTRLRVQAEIHAIAGAAPDVQDAAVERACFQQLCTEQTFDACIFQRLSVHALREHLPEGVAAVLDTHDLESQAAESRRQQAVPVQTRLSWEQELALFSQYQRVLLIQAEDHARVQAAQGERALLTPHPVQFAALPVQPARRRLGLVGSDWSANLHGLDWFADEVWPRLVDRVEGIEMHLFGWLSDRWRPEFTGFQRHGFVADFKQAWGAIDVAINPVRWGAGLKIKSVEALGHGLPLVTTLEGARGLPEDGSRALLRCDEPASFADACARLLEDGQARAEMAAAAHAYARQHFSPQACFEPLLRWLQQQVRA